VRLGFPGCAAVSDSAPALSGARSVDFSPAVRLWKRVQHRYEPSICHALVLQRLYLAAVAAPGVGDIADLEQRLDFGAGLIGREVELQNPIFQ
jgi:hypothetical protein